MQRGFRIYNVEPLSEKASVGELGLNNLQKCKMFCLNFSCFFLFVNQLVKNVLTECTRRWHLNEVIFFQMNAM